MGFGGVSAQRRWKADPDTIALRRRNREVFDRRIPQGSTGLSWVYSGYAFRGPPADISDCLVERPRPWLLTIWEPLPTKAPSPPKAAPFCCYLNTVIFYHSPYIVRPFARIYSLNNGRLSWCKPAGFEEWDKIETRFHWDDKVRFEGDHFEIGGGTVLWAKRRWWMRRGARRLAS